ncbi:oligosaccharide flippase family protein [Pseudomonas syringae]|uniref:oligosaccharide flippase family protein n=2 Tax=Pseudomonas syringae TaxID=317 RepID=UPI00200A63E7|nr:polysaccharide biosynthesis C-terminal domain-containing protein [Pseudomonas syringae]MCK9735545.1 polysaccharide biosynthesis C-terminal domain-containing protein [Pseudomonas syringae pv. syringae]MDF7793108.1 polysaccharide biosynthesis C-terminal domain-containing protein [Pseudomonas syringae]
MSTHKVRFASDENIGLLKKISHSTVVQFFSIVASLLLSSYLIRRIGADSFGVITSLNAILAICLIFTTFGWPVILTKTFAIGSHLNSMVVLKRSLKDSIIAIVFVSALLFGLIWSEALSKLSYGFIFLPLLLLLRSLTALAKAVLDGIGRVIAEQYSIGILLPFITIACFAIVDVSGEINNVLLVYSFSAFLGLMLMVSIFFFTSKPRLSDEQNSTSEWKRSGNLWLMSTSLSNVVLLKADVIIMGHYVDSRSIAIYGLICQVVTVVTMAISAGNSIFGPVIVKQYQADDLSSARQTFRLVQKCVLIWSLPLFLVLSVFPGFVLSGLVGEPVDGVFNFCLILLAFAQMVNAGTGPVATALYMKGEIPFFALSMMASVVLNVIANLLLMPRYGVLGAATATATVIILVNFVQYFRAKSLKIA